MLAPASYALDGRFDDWAKIKTPTSGPSKTIGFYSAGCLAGAVKLKSDGPGISLMRTSRRRYYAHPEMETYLDTLVQDLRKQGLPVLLVGDVSPPRGGPMAAGHNSHQGGLDADIWLMMSRNRPTAQQKESWSAPAYVENRKKLKSNWSDTQIRLMVAAASISSVNRIFIAPAIKKYFCDHMPTAPWLHKLRAWWGHEEHLHVRLNCPADSPQCMPHTPALSPADSGCGTELDWWFSKEADDEWQKIISTPSERLFPELPPECENLAGTSLRSSLRTPRILR
jgi:penicillin-insensitive murein endopeptidase